MGMQCCVYDVFPSDTENLATSYTNMVFDLTLLAEWNDSLLMCKLQ